jgi:hypothetical protein
MNCPYCQQLCEPDSRYTDDVHNQYGLCKNHKHLVEVWENPSFPMDEPHLCTYLFHKANRDRLYRVLCTKMGTYETWELADVSIQSNPVPLIKLSPITHNINPDNIDNKIKTLLLFM